MSIGSIGGFSSAFNGRSTRNNIALVEPDQIAQQLKTTKAPRQSAVAAQSAGGPQPNFPGGSPPKEVSKDDLTRLRDNIAKTDGAGAEKIDQLINNFDKYDTKGSGKISIDTVKSYADQNGIALPKPPQGAPGAGQNFPPGGFSADSKASSPQALKGALAGFLSRYSFGNSASSVDSTAQTNADVSAAPKSDTLRASVAKGTSTPIAQRSTAQLEKDAANGDAQAKQELERRKHSDYTNESSSTADSIDVIA